MTSLHATETMSSDKLQTYVSKPTDYPHSPARLLLLLTGGTGLHSVNNQIQADKFASEGFVVAMPDLFTGDPAPTSTTIVEEDTGSFLDQVKLRAVETAKSFLIDMWLARQSEDKIMRILCRVIDGCKEKFADAIATGGGIHAVGYCIGGRYILLLGTEREWRWAEGGDEEEGGAPRKGPLIKVGALAHGASITPHDFEKLKIPVSMVCVENDPLFPEELRTVGEDAMEKANVEHEVKVYPGVPHGRSPTRCCPSFPDLTTVGFAVVGEYPDFNIKEAQATAYEQMLDWVKSH